MAEEAGLPFPFFLATSSQMQCFPSGWCQGSGSSKRAWSIALSQFC